MSDQPTTPTTAEDEQIDPIHRAIYALERAEHDPEREMAAELAEARRIGRLEAGLPPDVPTNPDSGEADMTEHGLVLCTSPDGWSLHAPGSTDAAIASGDAPYLASGPGRPTQTDYDLAASALRLATDGGAQPREG